jgi:hypothetical protein
LAAATGGTVTYSQPNGAGNGVGALLTTTGSFNLIDTANIQTVGTRVLVKNEANAVTNGVYTWANATNLIRSTDTNTYGAGNPNALGLNDYFFVSSGNVNLGSAYIVNAPTGTITFGTSNISFAQFSLTQVYSAGTGLTLNGTTFSVNASQTGITSVGTLGSLSVTGTTTTGNLATGGTSSATGNVTGGNILTGGLISATGAITVGGDVSLTGNIVDIGTMWINTTSNGNINLNPNGSGATNIPAGVLSVTGNVVAGNISATNHTGTTVSVTGVVTGASLVGAVSTASQTGITSVGTLGSLSVTGNINAGNVNATLNGSGANVTSISATNISSGTLAQARLANSSITVNGTSIALGGSGTVTATATGTLTIGTGLGGTSYNGSTGVTITNTGVTSVVAGTNIAVSGATGAVTVSVTGTVPTATTAATVTTAAQPNITSVGTLTGLTINNATTAITNSATAGTGNIGASGAGFNTVFAKATSAQYADLAENYEADAEYAPGTVLVFGGDKEVTLALESGSTRVAGVVSTNPAYLMNSDLAAEHVASIALQGRVPCRVVGPVAKGDMMVSAGNGAARVDNAARAGSIIGKALENFSGAEGTIEVVIGRN